MIQSIRHCALLITIVVAIAIIPVPAYSQQSSTVFQSAFARQFTVLGCTNANPIVVTIQAPAATDALAFIPLDAGSLVTIRGVGGNTACNVTNAPISVLSATTFELTGVIGNGAFTAIGVGTSDTISTASTPSIPLDDIGQSGHLLSIEFPTAMGTVSPIQVRLEAAYNCPDLPFCATADWLPISEDITEVIDVGGTYYQFLGANSVWRAIRVNSILATPTSLPMRVDYTGSPWPLGPIIFLGDRFEILSPYSSGEPSYEFVAGACQNGTAGLAFNGAAPLPESQCITGGDETLAVAAFDDTTTEGVEDSFLLPAQGTPGTAIIIVYWQAASTGTMEWSLEFTCVGAGDELGAVAFGAAVTVTGTAASANELTATSFGSVPIGCLASEYLFWRLERTGGEGTLSGDALLKSIVFQPSQ